LRAAIVNPSGESLFSWCPHYRGKSIPSNSDDQEGEDEEDFDEKALYFYTQNPRGFIDHGADRWQNPNGNPQWPAGYYLTDLNPQEAAQLRRGQLSFALFGHRYVWENGGTVFWVRVYYSEDALRNMDSRPIHDLRVLGGTLRDREVYYRGVGSTNVGAPRAGGSANPIDDDHDEEDETDLLPKISPVGAVDSVVPTERAASCGGHCEDGRCCSPHATTR
jgi:hypothetical protein